jgi:hypothetical protein
MNAFWKRVAEEYEKAKDDPTYDSFFNIEGKQGEVGRMALISDGVVIIVKEAPNANHDK